MTLNLQRYCNKKDSVPVIELLPLSSKFTFHFCSVKTDLGLLNSFSLLVYVILGLRDTSQKEKGSAAWFQWTCWTGPCSVWLPYCRLLQHRWLFQHQAPLVRVASPAPDSWSISWPAASPATHLGWLWCTVLLS